MNIQQQVEFNTAQQVNGMAAMQKAFDASIRGCRSNAAHKAFVEGAAAAGYTVNQNTSFKTVEVVNMNAPKKSVKTLVDGIVKSIGTKKVLTTAEKNAAKKADKAAKALKADQAKVAANLEKVIAKEAAVEAKVKAEKLNDTENYNKAVKLVSVKDMKATAGRYAELAVQAHNKLDTLKDIGEQLVLIKADFEVGLNAKGATTYDDIAFGRCIAATPLSVISRRDRGDCVWLANNWLSIDQYRKDGITTNSISYLRLQVTEAEKKVKAEAAKVAKELEAARLAALALLNGTSSATDDDAIEGEYHLVDGEAKPPQTLEALCATIQALVAASAHSMADVVPVLKASLTTVIKAA